MSEYIKYKLVRKDLTTYHNFRWAIGQWFEAEGPGSSLCTSGVLHAFHSPIQARLFSYNFLDKDYTELYEVEIDRICDTDSMTLGSKRMRLLRPVTAPNLSNQQKLLFAVFVARGIAVSKSFCAFTDDWLSCGRPKIFSNSYRNFAREMWRQTGEQLTLATAWCYDCMGWAEKAMTSYHEQDNARDASVIASEAARSASLFMKDQVLNYEHFIHKARYEL